MKAIKANRVYTISEQDKESFRKQGYDIYDDKGKVVAYGAGKTVPYEQYAELLEKYEALKKKTAKKAEEK